jgi:hypothetical protein
MSAARTNERFFFFKPQELFQGCVPVNATAVKKNSPRYHKVAEWRLRSRRGRLSRLSLNGALVPYKKMVYFPHIRRVRFRSS